MVTLFICEFVICLGFIAHVSVFPYLADYTQTNQVCHYWFWTLGFFDKWNILHTYVCVPACLSIYVCVYAF